MDSHGSPPKCHKPAIVGGESNGDNAATMSGQSDSAMESLLVQLKKRCRAFLTKGEPAAVPAEEHWIGAVGTGVNTNIWWRVQVVQMPDPKLVQSLDSNPFTGRVENRSAAGIEEYRRRKGTFVESSVHKQNRPSGLVVAKKRPSAPKATSSQT